MMTFRVHGVGQLPKSEQVVPHNIALMSSSTKYNQLKHEKEIGAPKDGNMNTVPLRSLLSNIKQAKAKQRQINGTVCFHQSYHRQDIGRQQERIEGTCPYSHGGFAQREVIKWRVVIVVAFVKVFDNIFNSIKINHTSPLPMLKPWFKPWPTNKVQNELAEKYKIHTTRMHGPAVIRQTHIILKNHKPKHVYLHAS
jgi:hypothetical protein